MDKNLRFENLYENTNFFETDGPEYHQTQYQQNYFSTTKFLLSPKNIETIDEEMFQISPILSSKNVDFYFGDFEKPDDKHVIPRKHSMTSTEDNMIMNDFQVT